MKTFPAKFLLLFLAGAVLILLQANAHAAPANRPNILFVFIDDIGWGDLSCYGSSVTNKLGQPITPNLDRVAAQGIRFTQGYVASPICSPSRTAVLTGMEPSRYAIYSFLNNKASNASRNMADWVQPDTVTAPRLFKQAGYRTGQFGKWHMGGGRDVNDAPFPQDYGFEESLVAFEGMGDRILYLGDNLSQANTDVPGNIEWVEWYEGAGKHTEAALRFMTNAVSSGKPFYMHVPYNDTHSPYDVPPGQENDFDHITTDSTAKIFLGELHNLDKQIGRLIQAVDGLGIATNTLIAIVGDNGAPDDALETLLRRNGGLRSGKGNLYEGGFREPFLIRWVGHTPAGVVNSNTVVSTLDLLPTYCSLAGVKLPNAPFAGEDMSDVFLGTQRSRVRPLFWEYGTVSGLSPASPKLAIRDGSLKFMRNPDGTRRELYLIPNDHAETTNLVNQAAYASAVTNLESKLMAWYDHTVLGNVGESYPCETATVTGVIISDDFEVTGGNSPTTGFGANSGVNYEIVSRLQGAAASSIQGYRLGATGGTAPRTPSDFSISGNRLAAAPKSGNGRFEFSSDGTVPFNFGPYLAGNSYELSVQMNISAIGAGSQRLSISIADSGDAAVQNVDLGLQIGSDGAGGLAVYKRLESGSSPNGNAVNNQLLNGLPIGVPIFLQLRVNDSNANVSDFASTYEILVNGDPANSGSFRFNSSTTARHLIFDVAGHTGAVHYDTLGLTVTGSNGGGTTCRKPVLSFSELNFSGTNATVRLHWTVQPGTTVRPELSRNLLEWSAINKSGNPLSITTEHGTIQWLEVPLPDTNQPSYFRLRKE